MISLVASARSAADERGRGISLAGTCVGIVRLAAVAQLQRLRFVY